MQQSRFRMAILFPLVTLLLVPLYAGSLGVVFMVLQAEFNKWAVVLLGMALVVGVPLAAMYLENRLED